MKETRSLSKSDNEEIGGESHGGWGLWPENEGRGISSRALFHYWFVQYNPLYFFSALCVLGGVYLVAAGLSADETVDIPLGQTLLFVVIQVYEISLLGSAALLARKAGILRPAVMLVLLAALFLFDPTFRLETLTNLGDGGIALMAAWVLLTSAKLWAVSYVLPLRIPAMVHGAVFAGALGLAVTLILLGQPEVDRVIVLLAAGWLGGVIVAALLMVRPQVQWTSKRHQADLGILRRSVRGVFLLLVGFYFYHLLNYIIWVAATPDLLLALGSIPLLLLALSRHKEAEVWVGVTVAFVLALTLPTALVGTAMLASATLAYRAWKTGPARFATGAVLAFYVAAWSFDSVGTGGLTPPPGLFEWPTLVTIAALLAVGWRLREPTAWLVLIGGVLWRWRELDIWRWLPETKLGKGVLLLVMGFAALVGGVAVNWWLRNPLNSSGERPEGNPPSQGEPPEQGTGEPKN